MFFHPVCIHRHSSCREAIIEFLRLLRKRKVVAKHMGNDELCRWWNARSASAIGPVRASDTAVSFDCDAAYQEGMVVKAPLGRRRARGATVDGAAAVFRRTQEFGQEWGFVAVPKGAHTVEIVME
jgi:hypothetical protein